MTLALELHMMCVEYGVCVLGGVSDFYWMNSVVHIGPLVGMFEFLVWASNEMPSFEPVVVNMG